MLKAQALKILGVAGGLVAVAGLLARKTHQPGIYYDENDQLVVLDLHEDDAQVVNDTCSLADMVRASLPEGAIPHEVVVEMAPWCLIAQILREEISPEGFRCSYTPDRKPYMLQKQFELGRNRVHLSVHSAARGRGHCRVVLKQPKDVVTVAAV